MAGAPGPTHGGLVLLLAAQRVPSALGGRAWVHRLLGALDELRLGHASTSPGRPARQASRRALRNPGTRVRAAPSGYQQAAVIWAATSFELDMDVVVRLLGATVLGGVVGIEREASDQPAGLRTHIAVAVGAALFGVVSTLGFLEFDQPRANSTIQADVTRVASNVVVGIGFLGAGVIFRRGNSVRNLTTAASLWAVAAVGLACGVGDVTSAAVGTAVLLGSLVLLRPIRDLISRRWSTATTTVRIELAPGVEPSTAVDRFPTEGGWTPRS